MVIGVFEAAATAGQRNWFVNHANEAADDAGTALDLDPIRKTMFSTTWRGEVSGADQGAVTQALTAIRDLAVSMQDNPNAYVFKGWENAPGQ
jgi:hypothetical protein